MFYLLSDEQKTKISCQYWAKLIQLFTISLGVVFLMTVCLSVPTALKMYVEYSTLQQSIEPLEKELATMKVEVAKEGVNKILADFEILSRPAQNGIDKVYQRFIDVSESVSGTKIQSLNIDTLTKTIQVTFFVSDKTVAQALVKKMAEEKYVGAELPYSVLSQKSSFTFAQKLTYE